MDEGGVAFLDQVVERQVESAKPFGDAENEVAVRRDQFGHGAAVARVFPSPGSSNSRSAVNSAAEPRVSGRGFFT